MNEAEYQPDELGALKDVVEEFVKRLQIVENEILILKEDKKELVTEFKEKLDMSTLNQAMRVVRLQTKVKHKDTFDTFVEIISKYTNVGGI